MVRWHMLHFSALQKAQAEECVEEKSRLAQAQDSPKKAGYSVNFCERSGINGSCSDKVAVVGMLRYMASFVRAAGATLLGVTASALFQARKLSSFRAQQRPKWVLSW